MILVVKLNFIRDENHRLIGMVELIEMKMFNLKNKKIILFYKNQISRDVKSIRYI
jgi:hypothetical protein